MNFVSHRMDYVLLLRLYAQEPATRCLFQHLDSTNKKGQTATASRGGILIRVSRSLFKTGEIHNEPAHEHTSTGKL